MRTPFDNWLSQLRRAGKGGVILPPHSRGRTLRQTFRLAGDFSGAAFRSEIRAAPDAGTLLAALSFSVPAYDTETGQTTVVMSLSAANTLPSVLPAPVDPDETAWFPFDILITPSGGTAELLLGGVVPIIGRVTQ